MGLYMGLSLISLAESGYWLVLITFEAIRNVITSKSK